MSAPGPSHASREPGNEIKSPEKVIQQMEIHSNQPTADDAGAERSLEEAEKDDDSDDSDSIIYTPEGSDEEDEGQEAGGNDQHGPFEENHSTQDTNPGSRHWDVNEEECVVAEHTVLTQLSEIDVRGRTAQSGDDQKGIENESDSESEDPFDRMHTVDTLDP